MKTKAEIVQNLLDTYAISPEEAVILLTPTPHIEKETFLWQPDPLPTFNPEYNSGRPYCMPFVTDMTINVPESVITVS